MVTTKEQLYSVLLDLRATYQDKLEALRAAQVIDIMGTGYTNHQADDATEAYDQTMSASALRSVSIRLQQIEDAIVRYQSGAFGTCENCGQEIDIARLEAIPYTALCLRCAESRDYHAGV